MQINGTLRLLNNQFYPQIEEKKSIFLHHTAGTNARSCIEWWNKTPDHVGAAYVIDRDGTVYEAFDPRSWAYHLGIKGDDDFHEKFGIGIEIVSLGGLHRLPSGNTVYAPAWPATSPSIPVGTEDTFALEKYRGYDVFHRYTPAQISSVVELIKYLAYTFNIRIQPNLDGFWEYNENVVKCHWTGLWSHTTVREDKSDIFPQPELIQAFKDAFSVPV